jgi:CO/xanthine dehydrogenase FAD-binding subunit
VSVEAFTTATTVDEALAALAAGARPVAGGTDLVVGARQGKAPLPSSLVAIHRIDELRRIEETERGIRLGSLVTHADLVGHPTILGRLTALADASAIVGSRATRAHGTIGGNVMNASPAMETGGPLMCFDATATLRSAAGVREVAVEELFVGPGRTLAEPDELLVGLEIPLPAAGTGSAYVRLEYRRQMEIAVVGATAVVTLDGDRVAGARIAITALAPTIRRVPEAEAALVGTACGSEPQAKAAAAAAAAASPISDVRASERYRRAMAEVIASRAIGAALARARGRDVPVPASPALHGGLT